MFEIRRLELSEGSKVLELTSIIELFEKSSNFKFCNWHLNTTLIAAEREAF